MWLLRTPKETKTNDKTKNNTRQQKKQKNNKCKANADKSSEAIEEERRQGTNNKAISKVISRSGLKGEKERVNTTKEHKKATAQSRKINEEKEEQPTTPYFSVCFCKVFTL